MLVCPEGLWYNFDAEAVLAQSEKISGKRKEDDNA